MASKDAADQNFDYMFKLLIIGNSSVGKTSFLFRYADDSFTSAFVSTVGIDFKVKTVFRQDKRVKLQIWVSEYFVVITCFNLIMFISTVFGFKQSVSNENFKIRVSRVHQKLHIYMCIKFLLNKYRYALLMT